MIINLEKQVNNNGELILAAYEFVKQLGKKNINDVEKNNYSSYQCTRDYNYKCYRKDKAS